MKKGTLVIGILMLTFLVSGCVKEAPPTPQPTTPPPTTAPPTAPTAPTEEFPEVDAPLPEEQIEEPEFAADETVELGPLL